MSFILSTACNWLSMKVSYQNIIQNLAQDSGKEENSAERVYINENKWQQCSG